jgi:hypothetical protein
MQTSEIPRPLLSSTSYSADGFLKETPKAYEEPQEFLVNDVRSPYNADEKGIEEQSPRPSRFNPHRKYSKDWWVKAWDISVEVGRWPRIIYFSFGAILIAIWVVVMLTFANNVVKDEKSNSAGTLPKHGSRRQQGQLIMQGTLTQFDPDARVLTISWALVTPGSDNVTLVPIGATNDTAFPYNIYRDVKAIPENRSSPYSNNTIDLTGQYRIDNATLAPIAVLGQHDWDNVDTDIDFAQAVADNAWKQPEFAYPFDVWQGSIVLAATDREAAEAAGLSNAIIVELSDVSLTDSTLNWKITADPTDTCQLPDVFSGCELHINLTARRPALVIFATIVAVIVNWTSTISIFLLTGEAVVMKRYYILRVCPEIYYKYVTILIN